MKRFLAVLCCILALPLAAQSRQTPAYGAPEWEIPSGVYEAFLELPALRQQQQALRGRGFDLTEEEQERLTRYEQSVKGLIMVEVGFSSCPPCRVLFNELTRCEAGVPSVLQQWQNKGGRFYQLDWVKDMRVRSGKNLSALWQVQAAPVLLFFKNGAAVARLNGINPQNPAAAMEQIKGWIKTAGQ